MPRQLLQKGTIQGIPYIDGASVASADQPRTVQTPRHMPNTDGKLTSNPTPGVCRDIPYQYTTGMRSSGEVVSVRTPRDTEENGVTLRMG
jgi:hypothetical protein